MGGLYISKVNMHLFRVMLFANVGKLGTIADRIRLDVRKSLVLVNPFLGLEEPTLFPSRVIPVGPVIPPLPLPELSKNHTEVQDFFIRLDRTVERCFL